MPPRVRFHRWKKATWEPAWVRGVGSAEHTNHSGPPRIVMLLLFALNPQSSSAPEYGTGLEFMPVLSVILPVILLAVIMWYGSRHAV